MDRGAWWAVVHGVAKSQTRLSDFTFTFQFHALEKEMATHSSVLAWRIPGMGEPGSNTHTHTHTHTLTHAVLWLLLILPSASPCWELNIPQAASQMQVFFIVCLN